MIKLIASALWIIVIARDISDRNGWKLNLALVIGGIAVLWLSLM